MNRVGTHGSLSGGEGVCQGIGVAMMSIVPDSACGSAVGVRSGLEVFGLPAAGNEDSSLALSPPPVSHSTPSPTSYASDALHGRVQLDSQQPPDLVGADSPQQTKKKNLHRIAEVRKNQGISERTLCKRLNIDLPTLRRMEDPTQDLSLADLVRVQEAMDVPLVELLEDSHSLARPIQERAKLVRIMKTVAALEDVSLSSRPKRLLEMLREQLVDLMPELADVGSWPQYGSRRGTASVARVLAQEISLSQLPSTE